MPTWDTTFAVEPFPDTPWDRRDLTLWQDASAHHTFTPRDHRRSVQITARLTAADERTAVAAGREEVNAFFPPSRYWVQNPRIPPSARAHQLLLDGAALYLRGAGSVAFRDRTAIG